MEMPTRILFPAGQGAAPARRTARLIARLAGTLMAGLAIGAVAGLAAGCGPLSAAGTAASGMAASGTATPGGVVVPWADRPVARYVVPPPPSYPAGARPCRPSDLQVSSGPVGAATGHIGFAIRLANRSAAACLLAGYPPALSAISPSGIVTPLAPAHGGFFGDPGPAANIAPGQTAELEVAGLDACQRAIDGQHVIYAMLRIGLPGGGTVDAPASQFNAVCGIWVSRFGVPAGQPGASSPPPSPLTISITAPATVRPGEDVAYSVTITNPTDRAYQLRPCPSYAEYLSVAPATGKSPASDGYVVRYYRLNCDTVREIGARQSVTYQMRLRLPAGLPVGEPAKFGWQMQGGTGPATATTLRTAA